ncbi:MAG TPA: zinc-dependent metalloprotease [Chitinophagaceae bacterium]
MKQHFLLALAAGCVLGFSTHAQPPAGVKAPADSTKSAGAKKPTVAEKTKGSKKHSGLFTFYQDTVTGSLQMYVRKDQLGKEFVYQSFSLNGPTSLFLHQSMHRQTAVFKIEKAFDKLELSEVNTRFWYDKNNPVSKTEKVDKPETVFYVDKFSVEDSAGYLISVDQLFLSDKMDPVKPITPPGPASMFQFNLGNLNPSKSKYANVRSYPNNSDVVVDLNYDNPMAFVGGGNDITDPRYIRVRMQHSFIEMPSTDYRSRKDDPRVGYFTQEVNDQTSINTVNFRDMIARWNLVKKDPSAAISEPVEPIVWWVENTTPYEYRQTIIEAGLKWNEAFEKAGFRNAVVMKVMPDDADWDPADIRYNVIRWVSSANPPYGAIGPSFVNPKTGQILGSDITIEWFSGSATPIFDELYSGPSSENAQLNFPGMNTNHMAACTLAGELKAQFVTGLTTLEAAGAPESEIREMHKQFLTYLVMHEMGHTLGLNHNMKASQMLSPAEVNNKEITRRIGLIGSVMDYPAINIANDRSKQGDYYTTKAGPYDLWAIEFGYRPFSNDAEETQGLNKILSRSTEPYLVFGNDADDMRSPGKAIDPRVNINDMTSDPVAYAEDRFKLVNGLMGKLLTKYSKPGQSYQELRARYGTLQAQRGNMVASVSRFIGGVYVDRSFPEQHSASKPFTPVPVATQKKAMEILTKYVFAPDAYKDDAQLFPYLQMQRRGYNFFSTTEDYKITANLNNHGAAALAHIMHPVTLQRVTNSRLYGNTYSVTDVLNDLSKGIFDADIAGNVNVYRQYLQTTFVKNLAGLVTAQQGVDEVTKAAARYTLKKLKTRLAAASATANEETKAHRANLIFLVDDATAVK